MGCDIHLHQEIKVDGRWEHYRACNVPRSYRLFCKMAGVRSSCCSGGHPKPISLPRGVPDDISVVTKLSLDRWDADGHSHSWLNASEIAELEEWLRGEMAGDDWKLERTYWGYLFENSWGGFSKDPLDYPERIEDIRFVFWFDS